MKNTLLKLLDNNIVTFMLGGSFALIGLIPDSILYAQQKFYAALSVIILFLAVALIHHFFGNVFISKDVIPQLIRFLNSKRIYRIKSNYHVDITYEHIVRNDSKEQIGQLCIPLYFDKNNPANVDPGVVIHSLIVDSYEILNPQDCYRSHYCRFDKGNPNSMMEVGQILIPFHSIGGLSPGKRCKIKIVATAKDGWFDLDRGTWISVDSDFVTDIVETEVHPPENKALILDSNSDLRSGIKVFHKESNYVDHSEISRISIPNISDSGTIFWHLTRLKLGYCYVVNFRAVDRQI